jgi:hypothetical protein
MIQLMQQVKDPEWQTGFVAKPKINRTPFNDTYFAPNKL